MGWLGASVLPLFPQQPKGFIRVPRGSARAGWCEHEKACTACCWGYHPSLFFLRESQEPWIEAQVLQDTLGLANETWSVRTTSKPHNNKTELGDFPCCQGVGPNFHGKNKTRKGCRAAGGSGVLQTSSLLNVIRTSCVHEVQAKTMQRMKGSATSSSG